MKIIKILSYLFLIIFTNIGESQIYYFSTIDDEIYRFNENNTLELISIIQNLPAPIFDIAISSDSTFYGISDGKIIELNLIDGSFNVLINLSSPSDSYTSLVCNNQNELFFIDNESSELFKFNIFEQSIESIAFLGFNTPGDLTFFKGNIIFPSFPYIKAFNLENNTISNIFCIPEINGVIWGMSNDFSSCQNNRILASNLVGKVWEIDFDNQVIDTLDIDTEGLTIYGMASINENLAAECSFQFEDIKCVTSVDSHGLSNNFEIFFFPNPINDILYIESNEVINRIEIYNLSGNKVKSFYDIQDNIQLNDLNQGIFLIKIVTSSGEHLRKILKK